MARTVALLGFFCAAAASLLFAALGAAFDRKERTWRPMVAFGGYLLVVPLVLLLNGNRTTPVSISSYLVTATAAAVLNALAVFVVVCGGSLNAYRNASPPHSRQVLALTSASAVLFVVADLFLLAGVGRDAGTLHTSARDEDALNLGETQALLGDFGTAPAASTMRGLNPAASAAAESMIAAVRAYDAGGDYTPEEEGSSATRPLGGNAGYSPMPLNPGEEEAGEGQGAAAQSRGINLFLTQSVNHGSDDSVALAGGNDAPATVVSPPPAAEAVGNTASHASSSLFPATEGDNNIDSDEAAEIELAATHYNESYRELMLQMTAPREAEQAQPFIGFSLTDNVKEGCLIVDGVFEAGPAYQVGVDVDHELRAIAGYPVKYMEDVGPLIRKHCHVGRVTTFLMQNENGEAYDASVWVMTAEDRFAGKNFYFDCAAHEIRQSDRQKYTWRPCQERLRGPSIADDEL